MEYEYEYEVTITVVRTVVERATVTVEADGRHEAEVYAKEHYHDGEYSKDFAEIDESFSVDFDIKRL